MKKNHIKKLCICSLLAALYVPLEWLASTFGKIAFLDSYQVPISCFPLILAALMFGVRWGVSTAIVGSFVFQTVMYGINWTSILWMVPTVIYALVIALLYKLFNKKDSFILIAINLFISAVILSTLNIVASYLSNWATSGEVVANLIAIFNTLKLLGGIVFAVIFALICPQIIKKIRKVIKL